MRPSLPAPAQAEPGATAAEPHQSRMHLCLVQQKRGRRRSQEGSKRANVSPSRCMGYQLARVEWAPALAPGLPCMEGAPWQAEFELPVEARTSAIPKHLCHVRIRKCIPPPLKERWNRGPSLRCAGRCACLSLLVCAPHKWRRASLLYPGKVLEK